MAWGNIELATIARSQDYTNIKHSEDNKGVAMQSSLLHNMREEEEVKASQVSETVKAEWMNKKFDAKEKGSGEYHSPNQDKKKEKEKDKVIVKKGPTSGGFDIKI